MDKQALRPATPLKLKIAEKGWTNRALSKKLGTSESHLSRVVQGLPPGPELAKDLARVLKVKPTELWPE